MNPIRFDQLPDMITVKQLSQFLGIGKNLTYRLIREGKIPCIKLGRNIRVPKSMLQIYLKKRTNNVIVLPKVKIK